MKANKNVFELLKNLIVTFQHCGWVNGLSDDQYSALNEAHELISSIEKRAIRKVGDPIRAKKLRKDGFTIRQIAVIMGYRHPGSVEYLLRPTTKKSK